MGKRIMMVKFTAVKSIECLDSSTAVAVYSSSHRQALIDVVEHYHVSAIGQEYVAQIETRHYYIKDGLVSELIY